LGEIDSNPTYDHAEFWVAMQHLYLHLNTAWNARDEAPERVAATSEEDAASANSSPLLHAGVNRG